MTSRSIALPPRFKCAVGGEWKTNSEFSQNQLKRWSQKKRHDNDGITSVNIGLVCKVHSGAPQNTTIKCEGPCGQMKVRDAFSKNQRNRPDAWCKRCTEWKERQQPDEIPTAPPNANMSHDEVYLDTSQAVDNDDLNLNVVQDDSDDDVHNSSSGDDDEDDGPSVLRSTLRSLHQSSRGKYHDDDNGNGDHDDRADDTRNITIGNSIVGLQPAPSPSVVSLNSTQASFGGSQVSSMAEGPRPMRSSYAGTASIISTGTTQTARQNNPTSTTNSVVSGDNRSMGWVPPHLRGRRDASQQPGSLATASTQRPQLRGMAGPNLGTAIPPHLRGIQPSTASTDSRAGIQSFASSTVGSTTGTDALQPSNVHEYNAFSPHGQVYRETTGGIPANGTGTFMSGRKEIKVSRHGWQRGDNRKRFDVPPMFASVAEEPIEEPDYSSGSADEM